MRFSEITEAFDKIMPLTWHDRSTKGSSSGYGLNLIQAEFQIDDGHFVIQFSNNEYEPGYWEFSFTRNKTFNLTGTGNASVVLATVMQAAREFIESKDPRWLTFQGKNAEESRNKLYPRLQAILAKEFPQYATASRRKHSHTEYTAERPAPPPPPPPKREPVQEQPPLTAEEWAEMEAFLDREFTTPRNR